MANTFMELIEQARSGSDSAATELVERYQPHILRAVRRKMAREIRPKFDSQDFVQAVWTSFFRNQTSLLGADSPEQLIGLLATMARNKVIDELRRRMETKKYNVQKESSLDSNDQDGRFVESGSHTPSQLFIAREKLAQILDGQSTQNRSIILLRIEGRSQEEIAEELGISVRTVRRVIGRIQKD